MTHRIKAVLFDLDDTLLGNDINGFIQNYLPMLAKYVSKFIDPVKFVEDLMAGTQAMFDDIDPETTNAEVFWKVFYERTGLDNETFKPVVDRFYIEEFDKLRSMTRQIPEATRVVEFCMGRGLQTVVATNPLFPLTAIEQRLDWAGLPVGDYDFDLVTSYEIMHASKPHPEYYHEILSKIGVGPELAIMVGDDWANDISGADKAGLFTYWIDGGESDPSVNIDDPHEKPLGLLGQGTLGGFYDLFTGGELEIAA